jgi:hypothetical protein
VLPLRALQSDFVLLPKVFSLIRTVSNFDSCCSGSRAGGTIPDKSIAEVDRMLRLCD